MIAAQRIVCRCGGPLSRPLPLKCPHCGAVIARVRRGLWPRVWPPLAIGAMIAGLVAFLIWAA